MLKDLAEELTQMVFPPICLSCHISLRIPPLHTPEIDWKLFQSIGLCPQCFRKISVNKPSFCIKCSRHLEKHLYQSICRTCTQHQHHFDFAWSACLYTKSITHLIYQFKYGQTTALRHLFILLIKNFIKEHNLDISQFDLIIPTPLHPVKKRERGYNQSQLIGLEISREYHIPMISNNLIKTRHTRSQAQCGAKERWTNVEQAFRIRRPSEIKNHSILIVDDLLTTGATASQAALSLKESKASLVGVLTLAITP